MDKKEKRRLVEVIAIFYLNGHPQGAIVREMDKPLNGIAMVGLNELREWRD